MKMNAACYMLSSWYEDDANMLSLQRWLNVPLEFNLVRHEKANIIFIIYGGNADHIPYIEQLLQEYPKKTFVFIIGEYLRRTQPLLAKKISSKASVVSWARAVFPFVYPLAHRVFPYPKIARDKKLFKCLLKYKDNPRIHLFLCEDAPELGNQAYNYPIFIRDFISTFVPRPLLSDTQSSSQKRIEAIKQSIYNRLDNYSASNDISERTKYCSTIFGNTTLERVEACKSFSKHNQVQIYGKNPITKFGKLEEGVDSVYNNSQFVLCFENISADGYITEKLFNVIRSQAIPIYWGAKNIENYCNLESIILCKDIADIQQLGARITHMSEEELSTIQRSPYFLPLHIEYFVQSYEEVRSRCIRIVESC